MHDEPERICLLIKNWDLKDVSILISLIEELEEVLGRLSLTGTNLGDVSDWLDLCNLPSAPIPDWVNTGYPVWAMDEGHMLMVGSDPFETMPLSEML